MTSVKPTTQVPMISKLSVTVFHCSGRLVEALATGTGCQFIHLPITISKINISLIFQYLLMPPPVTEETLKGFTSIRRLLLHGLSAVRNS